MDNMKAIEELKNNQAFLAQLKAAENDQQISQLFAEHGITVTEEQIRSIREGGNAEELNEDDLDAVAGGYGILVGVAVILFLAGLARGARCK